MAKLCYQELNLLQIFDVLRSAGVLHLALSEDGQPYVIPMHFQLEVRGSDPILHMVTPPCGHAMNILRRNDRVCAEIDLPGCAWLDTVVIQSRATIGVHEPGRAVDVCILPGEMTGRRYFQQDGS